MMAVEEGRQPEALRYLLTLEEYYPLEEILQDTNANGTTLLNAAVQLAHNEIVEILLDFLFAKTDANVVAFYLTKSDVHGRTVAHYLFSTPSLLARLGSIVPWRLRDKHGQTPLFALCRSYDHPEYKSMVQAALTAAQQSQGDNKPLQLDDHVDAKGNTLLHIVGDPEITRRILQESDCDPNATNDKRFTPLMMASKYGRVDQVRILFRDPRVDVHIKEARGLTAVELAKDDEVRNRIDDLILLSHPPSACGDPFRPCHDRGAIILRGRCNSTLYPQIRGSVSSIRISGIFTAWINNIHGYNLPSQFLGLREFGQVACSGTSSVLYAISFGFPKSFSNPFKAIAVRAP